MAVRRNRKGILKKVPSVSFEDEAPGFLPANAEELCALNEVDWDQFLLELKTGEIQELIIPTIECRAAEFNTSTVADESVLVAGRTDTRVWILGLVAGQTDTRVLILFTLYIAY